MPYRIEQSADKVIVELTGGITARDASELAKALVSSVKTGMRVAVRTGELEDVDTSILQMLVSLRKTVAELVAEHPSDTFITAVDRCALRGELLNQSNEAL